MPDTIKPSNDKYIGKMLDDRYEILEKIGEGGMAVVYKALCHRLDRYVAVKIMRDEMAGDEEFRQRFCAESHAVAMLSHPNIVAVYDVSHNDTVEYIVMELVDGITLRQYMDKRGPVPWREALHFTRQMAKALSHAHERGIIHRDIKPQNVMLLKDGTIKIGDFGIAALENELHEENGETIGSIHYIAPEQARGELPDSRSDLYSLGVVMYEMLTGQKPYTGESIGEIAIKHMNADPVPPRDIIPDIPEELQAMTLKAMCPEIGGRYQTAAELLQDLEAFAQAQLQKDAPADDAPLAAEEKQHHKSHQYDPEKERQRELGKRRRHRARRVAFASGALGAMVLSIGLFVFLWNFWLKDVFAPAERIEVPDFVGDNYESVTSNAEFAALYRFNVVYVVDPQSQSGLILSQDPEPGRSVMISSEGIPVELSVSTGTVFVPVPDVVNMDYREASSRLQQAGFLVSVENVTSDQVPQNYVISSSPAAGEELSSGSTVYLTVSGGPNVSFVQMPNLIGLSEELAITKLQSAGLSYGGSQMIHSELDPGTVIGQSVEAFAEVEAYTNIQLQVSAGPEG